MTVDFSTLLTVNKVEKNKISLLLFFSILLLFDGITSVYINADLFTLAIWFMFCFVIFLKHIKFFIKYCVYLFYYTTNVLAVYIIENSTIHLYELGTYSTRNNSLFLVTLTHCFFVAILLLSDSTIEKRVRRHSQFAKLRYGKKSIENCIIFILAFVFIIASLYVLSKAIVKPASKYQMDRFIYEKTFISGIWSIIHYYLIYLVPILVMLSYKKKNFLSSIALIFYCAYMYLVGHKFGIFISVFAFYIPYIIEHFKLDKISFKNINKIFIIGTVAIFALLTVLYTFQSKTYSSDKQQFIKYLYERLAQQGQMWWAVYGKEQGTGFHFDELSISLGSFFGINRSVIDNYDFGIYKMMKLVTPYNIYLEKMEKFSRYAFSTESTLYYYFKEIGLIGITGLMSLFLSYIVNWYWREVRQFSWFGSIISGFFYTLILSVYLQSDFNVLFSKRKLLVIAFFFVIRKIGLALCLKNKQKCLID